MTEKVGILYDSEVSHYPIVSQVMWWTRAGVQFLIQPTEYDLDLDLSVAANWQTFPDIIRSTVAPPVFVEAMPLDELVGLIIIRSHPEMFGPEIRAFSKRETDLGIEVWTIEQPRHRAVIAALEAS